MARSFAATALLLVTLAGALPARATPLRLNLGGDYVFDNRGLFSLTLTPEAHLARHLRVGARFGGFLETSPATLGVPLDLDLRASVSSAYLEALFGPWIFFSGEAVRAHVAFGFGLTSRGVGFGIELGWLSSGNALLGARLSVPI